MVQAGGGAGDVGAGCSRQGLLAQHLVGAAYGASSQLAGACYDVLGSCTHVCPSLPIQLHQLPAHTLGASAASALPLPFALGLAARSGRAGLRDLPLPAGLRLLVALRLAAGLALRLPLALALPAGLRDLDLEVLPELLRTGQGALDDDFMAQAARRRVQCNMLYVHV